MAYSKTTQYTCLYEGMRGVDLSADGSERRRFSYIENMWRDYDGDAAAVSIESIPGFRRLMTLPARVHGIYRQTTEDGVFAVVHAGGYLYRFPLSERDSGKAPMRLSSLSDGDSCALAVGECLYVLDGKYLRVVKANGSMGPVDDGGYDPYVPTLYEDGIPSEQRNLLTDRFRETHTVSVAEAMAYGSPGLAYEEAEAGTALVTGIGTATDLRLYIPARVTLGGRTLRVVGIADGAFAGNESLYSVHVACGVETVGEGAFEGCTGLGIVVLHDGVLSVGKRAFAGCIRLSDLYIGRTVSAFGEEALDECSFIERVHFAVDESEATQITGLDGLTEKAERIYGARRRDMRLYLPVCSPATVLTGLFLDGEGVTFSDRVEDGRVTGVFTDIADRTSLAGKTFTIEGRLSRTLCIEEGSTSSFLTSFPDYTGTAPSVIHGCTVCAAFDGRIFVSGNPALPGVVFYSQRNRHGINDPTYFGVLNYFIDGLGVSPVVGLLPTADALAVLKREDDGAGGIFYHKGQDTDAHLVPRIYPVTYAHHGLGAYGACLSFLDDPVFVGPSGIHALEHEKISLERSIGIRSHAISARLLHEDLSRVRLCRFGGYLVASVDGRMYLADARSTYRHGTGDVQYEWYLLDGVGTYTGDVPVYRYASSAPRGIGVAATVEERVSETLTPYITTAEDGTELTCVTEGGRAVAVYESEERRGGTFAPAEAVAVIDGLLLFGTADGSLCLFNTDRRGIPPARIAAADDFDAAAYRAFYGRRIHPDFYSFAGHAPRYALATVSDNVGLPHVSKRTVPHSLTVKCRQGATRRLTVEIGTDGEGFRTVAALPACSVSFDDMDLSALVFEQEGTVTVPIRERSRGWVEKQIAIYSDEYCSPIGISSIAYRYTVQGRIKQK